MKRSLRMEALEKRPVNQEGFIREWPEKGFVAMASPYSPRSEVSIAEGKITSSSSQKA